MPASASAATVNRIITSGPQTRATAVAGSNSALSTSFGTTPTRSRQAGVPASTVSWTSNPASRQRSRSSAVQKVVRRPRAVEQDQAAERVPPLEQRLDRRPQRRHPEAAGDDEDVRARGNVQRPLGPERSPHPDHVAAAGAAELSAHRADVLDRVHERAAAPAPAEGDRHLADAERGEHRELAGLRVDRLPFVGSDLERPRVGRLA